MSDFRNLPLAPEDKRGAYMQAARNWLHENTTLYKDIIVSSSKFGSYSELLIPTMFYMAVFSIAEKQAQSEGFTLIDRTQNPH